MSRPGAEIAKSGRLWRTSGPNGVYPMRLGEGGSVVDLLAWAEVEEAVSTAVRAALDVELRHAVHDGRWDLCVFMWDEAETYMPSEQFFGPLVHDLLLWACVPLVDTARMLKAEDSGWSVDE